MEASEIERATPWPALILSVALPASDVHALHEWQQALYKAVEAAAMEKAAKIAETTPAYHWVDGSDQWGNPCPAKIVTTRQDYAAAIRAAAKKEA